MARKIVCTLNDGCTKHLAVAIALAVNGPETPMKKGVYIYHTQNSCTNLFK